MKTCQNTIFQELERTPFLENQFQELEQPQKNYLNLLYFITVLINFKNFLKNKKNLK